MFNTLEDILKIAPQEIVDLITDLKLLRERPDYHPEESAYIHVKTVVERLIQTGDIDLIIAGLFHDIYKLKMNQINPKTGYPTAPGHDRYGAKLVIKYTEWVFSLGADPIMVSHICEQHMRIKQMDQMGKRKQEELRNMECFEKLQIFTHADNMLREWNWPIK